MFDFSYLDISAAMGLFATGLLTFNFLLGMMLSTAYKKSKLWKKMPAEVKRISIDNLHNWTAYIALISVVLHPLLLLADPTTKFTLTDIFFPIHAPEQKYIVLLGVISMYALLIVIITTQKKVKNALGFRAWKNIHLVSYGTALLFIFHGLLMDPELKNRPTDWLDAEKFVSEFCLLVLIIASIFRYRYFKKQSSSS